MNQLTTDKYKEMLRSLREDEQAYALSILKEMGESGNSKSYNDLLLADYKEIPVDIETFLTDKRYLGNGLINSEGKFTVFPFWVETLKKIFPDNLTTRYNISIWAAHSEKTIFACSREFDRA